MSQQELSESPIAKKSPTCYLVGQDSLLLECAQILLSKSFLIDGIISPSDDIRIWAQEKGINWFHSLADVVWQDHSADYLFSIVNNEIIPSNVLKKIGQLVINYQDAPLPRYAGSNATSWAILNGEKTHAITWHIVNECIDGGDILKQYLFYLHSGETALTLNIECFERAIASFSELVSGLLNNSYQRTPQNLTQRSYFTRAKKPTNNGWINWNNRAEQIDRLFRATQFGRYRNPLATCKLVLGTEVFVVDELTILSELSQETPGTIIKTSPSYWQIATQTHTVSLSALSTTGGQSVELDRLANQYNIVSGVQLRSPSAEEGELFLTLSQNHFFYEPYWVKKLKDFEPTTVTSKQAEVNLQSLPQKLYERFRHFTDNKKDVPFAVLAAWLIYLRRLEAQTQLNLFVQLGDSPIPENLGSFFASHLPFSVTINDQDNFHQVVDHVRQECQQLSEHGTYLKDCWHRYPELIDTNNVGYQVTVGDVTPSYDESKNILPQPFLTLVDELLAHPQQSIVKASWITEEERRRLLVEWNTTNTPFPAEKTIHSLFEEQVSKTPHHIALIAQGVQLTYQDLNNQANQLAHYLIAYQSIQPDQLVAVCLERSQWMLIALLGILKSGAAYVPLEPDYPAKQIEYILSGSKARVVVTTQTHAQQLRSLPNMDWKKTKLLVLDDSNSVSTLAQQSTANPVTATTCRNLAYVMYTSGTTGNPKGIQIEHQGVVNQITWMNRTYPLSTADKVLQRTPYVFDISVWELFLANWYGATVVFAKPEGHKEPDYLVQLIQQEQISVVQFTPTMFNEFIYELANKNTHLSSLRHIFCIGEVLEQTTVDRAYRLLPEAEIHNIYGPTEASINVLSYDCIRHLPVLIGKPIANTRAYVLDAQCRLLPVGVSGELYLAGIGLARGYINEPELTSQQFIANPFQTDQDKEADQYSRLYKTGDLARWLPNGQLDYLGRNDKQIKLRGYRIELSGIESYLNYYPGIKQAVVVVHQLKNSVHPYLIGYYVAQEKLKKEDIFFYLGEHLPDYMVPTYLVQLDAIPLTVNGKVDKKALPHPLINNLQAYVPPETDLENQLVSVWAAILGVPKKQVGVTESFLKLGGNSLLIIELKSQLSQLSHFETITVADLFKYSTIRQLSHHFESGSSPSAPVQVRKTYFTQETEIAIISASGAFSGGRDLEHYWKLIQSGEEGIQFYGLDECRRAGVSEDLLQNPLFIPSSGHIPDIDQFDAAFWGMSPKEAKNFDPQIRLFLEHCWYALEQSDYLDSRQESNIGVFAAAGQQRYCSNSMIFPLATNDTLATHVSYFLGLTGPANNINTACSGSLVTVVEACKNLVGGYCDLALAGGVSLLLPHERGYVYQEEMIRSKDGHCRVFDAKSSGTVFGSGVGVVLLKRLSEAKRDNDRIIGVIKGYASNNDGNRKMSYTAPSVLGQKECIIKAQEMAGISSDVIDYVECHGTGTKLGDPVEVQALDEAFKYTAKNPRLHPCVLGSVKANIGHADTAAGIAGLIKVCKMLENGLMPRQINYAQPNPELRLASTYFIVSTEDREWKSSKERPRIAAVSSLGIGGTNAHVIIAEAPEEAIQRNPHKGARSSGHQFEKQSYWSDSPVETTKVALNSLEESIYKREWKRIGRLTFDNHPSFASKNVIIFFSQPSVVIHDLLSAIKDLGAKGNSIDLNKEEQVTEFTRDLQYKKCIPDLIVYFSSPDVGQNESLVLCHFLFDVLSKLTHECEFVSFSFNNYEVIGRENLCAPPSIAPAMAIPFQMENPFVKARHYDVLETEKEVVVRLVSLLGMKSDPMLHPIYALRNDYLWSPTYVKKQFFNQPTTDFLGSGNTTFLITGAMGGVGATFVQYLINNTEKATLILLGRRNEKELENNIGSLKKQANQKQINLFYLQCELGSEQGYHTLLSKLVELKINKIDLVLHAAGVAAKSGLEEKKDEDIKAVIDPKVNGVFSLICLSEKIEIGILVNFSSVTSTIPASGNTEYIAANSFLDEISYRRFEHISRILTVNLNQISDKGMAYDFMQNSKSSNILTVNSFQSQDLPILLNKCLAERENHFVISRQDIDTEIKNLTLNLSKQHLPLLSNQFPNVLIEEESSFMEQQIASLFFNILGREKFSLHDSFFDLGGDSLDAIDLLSQLKKMGIALSLSDLVIENTVYRIAFLHENNLLNESPSKIVLPLSVHNQTNKNVFFIHPVGGTVLLYLDIVKDLTKEYNYYGIQNINILGKDLLKADSLKVLSEIYVREILKIQLDGEYILMGSSMGGTIAYEMATQLIGMGKKVKFVAMFDTWAIFSEPFHDKKNFTNRIKNQTEEYKSLFSAFKQTDLLIKASWEMMELLLNYQPPKSLVNIHLYKAEELDKEHAVNGVHEDNGWQQYTSLPLVIRSIPGTHMTMHFAPGRNKLVTYLNKSLLELLENEEC